MSDKVSVEVGVAFAHGQWTTITVEVLWEDPEKKDLDLETRAINAAYNELDARAEVAHAWVHYIESPDDCA